MGKAIRSVKIILSDGGEIPLLYTNRALSQAETDLGRSVLSVVQGFLSGKSGVTELATLLKVGMEAGRRDAKITGKSVTLDNAFEIMDDVGLPVVAEVILEAVAGVLTENREKVPVSTDEVGEDPNA